jgi:hypothetical protein
LELGEVIPNKYGGGAPMLEVFVFDDTGSGFSVHKQDVLYVIPVIEALQSGTSTERLHRELD